MAGYILSAFQVLAPGLLRKQSRNPKPDAARQMLSQFEFFQNIVFIDSFYIKKTSKPSAITYKAVEHRRKRQRLLPDQPAQ